MRALSTVLVLLVICGSARADDDPDSVYSGISCMSTRDRARVVFTSSGEVWCKPTVIAETAVLTVVVVGPAATFEAAAFAIDIVPGEAIGSRIHGDYSAIKEALEKVVKRTATKQCDSIEPPAGFTCTFKTHAPISAKDVAIKLVARTPAIDKSITISIAQTFAIGIGAMAAVTYANTTTYAVKDMVVTQDVDKNPLSYYITFELAVVPWKRRFYNYGFTRSRDRISLVGGIGLPDPRESLAAGVSVRIVDGVTLAALWLPRKREALVGSAVGQVIEGEISINKVWDFSTFGIGIGLDATLISRLTGALK
jgi:hypothetical protein